MANEYIILCTDSAQSLVDSVNKKLAEGYTPVGGPFILDASQNDIKRGLIAQAMIKQN